MIKKASQTHNKEAMLEILRMHATVMHLTSCPEHWLLGVPSEESDFNAITCSMIKKASQTQDKDDILEILRMHAAVMHLTSGLGLVLM